MTPHSLAGRNIPSATKEFELIGHNQLPSAKHSREASVGAQSAYPTLGPLRPRFQGHISNWKNATEMPLLRMASGEDPWEEFRARSAIAVDRVANFQLWFGEMLLLGAQTWVRYLERAAGDVERPREKFVPSSGPQE